MDKHKELYDILMMSMSDFKKFYVDGNKAAGRCVRKAMLELKKATQEVRVDVQERKKIL